MLPNVEMYAGPAWFIRGDEQWPVQCRYRAEATRATRWEGTFTLDKAKAPLTPGEARLRLRGGQEAEVIISAIAIRGDGGPMTGEFVGNGPPPQRP
jgi:hypothetical protein